LSSRFQRNFDCEERSRFRLLDLIEGEAQIIIGYLVLNPIKHDLFCTVGDDSGMGFDVLFEISRVSVVSR